MSMAKKQQQGIALITILMMVALATIIAASIAKHQASTHDNTAYVMRQNQALMYAKSAEAFFEEILLEDAASNSSADYLQETWAKPMPGFPIDGGMVSGQIFDESGKFNLNTLLKADGTPNPDAQAYFELLLKRVGLPAEISQAVIDWQDADDLNIGAMGAESQYYGGLSQPYMAANQAFHSVEELKQVRGFEGANYDLIAPYVTAIPSIDTKININTAPAMVLAALDDRLNQQSVQDMINAKQSKMEYFSNLNELWETAPFNQVDAAQKTLAGQIFDVKSTFFKANIEVVLSDRKRQFTSYMMRQDKSIYISSRSLAPF